MSLVFCSGCRGTVYGLKCSGLANGDREPPEKEHVGLLPFPDITMVSVISIKIVPKEKYE